MRIKAGVLTAAATFALLAGCSPDPDSNAQAGSTTPQDVTLTAAQRGNIHLTTVAASHFHKTIQAVGAVDFDNDQSTSVLAPFSGPVSRLLVSPGDHVQKGAALATVDSPDFAAAVGTYRKALATERTDKKLADMDKDLLAHKGVAEREEAQAQTDAANAHADSEAALQGLVALGVEPRTIATIRSGRAPSHVEGVIRAPIAGTVVEKLITPGQFLQAGTTPCFTVANLSRVWVLAQISSTDQSSVRVGDKAEVQTGIDGKTLTGTVSNISSLVNPDTRSVVARVVIDNPGEYLRKQMYVGVSLHDGQDSAGLLVPVSAVLHDDENLPFVYVAKRGGSFARRHVTLGYRAGAQYDVADGLKPGDKVVADGALFIQFMQTQ
jgi:cobalt-zinc-cadmium efflux system membrane fusion protein